MDLNTIDSPMFLYLVRESFECHSLCSSSYLVPRDTRFNFCLHQRPTRLMQVPSVEWVRSFIVSYEGSPLLRRQYLPFTQFTAFRVSRKTSTNPLFPVVHVSYLCTLSSRISSLKVHQVLSTSGLLSWSIICLSYDVSLLYLFLTNARFLPENTVQFFTPYRTNGNTGDS